MIKTKYQRKLNKAIFELRLAFDESKHPRGQPENKGEFAPVKGAKGGANIKGAKAVLNKKKK